MRTKVLEAPKLNRNWGKVLKYLEKCSHGKFYSLVKILTRMKAWNFITSARGPGKSTAVACLFILDFILDGHMFMYVRRDKDEVLLTCRTFFKNAVRVINEYCDDIQKIHSVEYEAGYYYLIYESDFIEAENNEEKPQRHVCGRCVPLSVADKFKSNAGEAFWNVVYDEFIPLSASKYLGNRNTPELEYEYFYNLYTTIDRDFDDVYLNRVVCFFLGNTAMTYNPFYLSLDMVKYICQDAKFINPKAYSWCMEQIDVKDIKALEKSKESISYNLASEKMKSVNFSNSEFDELGDNFIGSPQKATTLDGYFILCGKSYAIRHTHDNLYYIIKARIPDKERYYSLDVPGHNGVDCELIDRAMQNSLINWIHHAYCMNFVWFEDKQTRQNWLQYLNFIPK